MMTVLAVCTHHSTPHRLVHTSQDRGVTSAALSDAVVVELLLCSSFVFIDLSFVSNHFHHKLYFCTSCVCKSDFMC